VWISVRKLPSVNLP